MLRRFVMSLATASLVIGLVGTLAPLAQADIVISSFEEPTLASNLNADGAFEGLTDVASQFRSGAVTFDNSGVFYGGSSWSGIGYSRRTTVGNNQFLYNNSNDLISKPAAGAAGSATWAVVGGNGLMTADAGYLFSKLNVTNTLYSWTSMVNGDPFSGPGLTNGGGTGRFSGQDDFFTVRFTNTANAGFLDFNLADFRGATDYVFGDWQEFDLSGLAASTLSVSFLGSRESEFGGIFYLDTPAYAAFDNITVVAVPEPSSLLLVVAGGWLCYRWKRKRLQPVQA